MPHRRTVARKTAGGVNVQASPETPQRRYSRRRRSATHSDSDDQPISKSVPFNFEEIGLGLEMPVSSGTTSESDAGAGNDSEPGETSLSMALITECDELEPTPEWVRNLIELRRVKQSLGARPTAAGKEWLREQHRAFDAGKIPLTLKCTLAASGISDRFHECRTHFMRPEYRARYWSWSQNFVALIDYYINHGTINIPPKSEKKYPKLMAFIETCHRQRTEGTLPIHRDQLLTALGLQWKKSREEHDEYIVEDVDDADLDDAESQDSKTDETWEMPLTDGKLDGSSRVVTRKRLRSRRSTAKDTSRDVSKTTSKGVVMPNLQFDQVVLRPPEESDYKSMLDWAKTLVKIRKCFKKSQTYVIPDSQPSLLIWKNTELARAATGTLSMMRCCLLKAAKLADSIQNVEIDMACETWCRKYLEYLDFMLDREQNGTHYRKCPDGVFDFLYKCRESVVQCTFPQEYAILLRAADMRWLESRLMELSILRCKGKHISAKSQKVSTELQGPVVEVVLDSGWNREDEDPPVRKRRKKKTHAVCQKMVSSMIKGIVAENIEGRERTEAERRAEEWVTKAGTTALNHYAHDWFDAAAKHTHR